MMKSNEVKISVVVCTYNRAHLLPTCLESLMKQRIDNKIYEIVIIDNNSSDNTEDVVNRYMNSCDNMRLYHETRQGLGSARNKGWRKACGEYIAFIDDDAIADKEWLGEIINAFERVSPRPSAVGGMITPSYTSYKKDWFLDNYETRTFGNDTRFLDRNDALEGFSGSNMAIPKEILREYGGFEADMGMTGGKLKVGEETAFFNRIYDDQPYFWYDPNIRVEHLVPAKNMTVGYRLKRVFAAGLCKRRVHRESASLRNIMIILRRMLYESIANLFRLDWRQGYWQRVLLEYLTPIFYLLGSLTDNVLEIIRGC
ncbi:MAG: glycosyltransferase family 2 protein [Actinomycetota bacterium]|nr:glycosyltransferase family 2 protein [Actinomycetota bacterium]